MANDIILNVYGPDCNDQHMDDSLVTFGRQTSTPDWQDTNKYTSRIHDFVHDVGNVFGGLEDCVDINNGASNGMITAAAFFPQGKYCATIKGGSHDIRLRGTLCGHGSEVDVDLGNISDQSDAKTTGITLDLVSADGTPINVRVLNADKPQLIEGTGPYRYAFPHPDKWYHGICVWWLLAFRRWFKA